MERLSLSTFAFLVVTLSISGIVSGPAGATTYVYQGNLFDDITDNSPPVGSYDTTMRVTGSFTVANPLPADSNLFLDTELLAWSFSDGRTTLTESNSEIAFAFDVFTDASGDIVAWNLGVLSTAIIENPGDLSMRIFSDGSLTQSDFGGITQCLADPCGGANNQGDQGRIQGSPGTWSVVPEPSSVLLLAAGLIGLATRRR